MQGSGSCTHHGLQSREHFHKELVFSHLFTVGKHSNLDLQRLLLPKTQEWAKWHRNKTLEKAAIFLSHKIEYEDFKDGVRGPFSWQVFKRQEQKQTHFLFY